MKSISFLVLLSLKYYPDRNNSIGVVRTGIQHYKEFGFEIIDGFIRSITNQDNLFYDMHGSNSTAYLYYSKMYPKFLWNN